MTAMRRNIQFTVTYCNNREFFFLVSEYILTVSPPILERFSQVILLKFVYGLNLPPRFFAVAMAKITSYQPFFNFSNNLSEKLTICDQMLSSMLRRIINLVFKGLKRKTIQMDASDYKGLKSETIDNNKLEVSWSTTTTRAMHAGQQRVFNFYFACALDFTATDSVNQSVHLSVRP